MNPLLAIVQIADALIIGYKVYREQGFGAEWEVPELAVVGVHRALFAVRSVAERLQGTPFP